MREARNKKVRKNQQESTKKELMSKREARSKQETRSKRETKVWKNSHENELPREGTPMTKNVKDVNKNTQQDLDCKDCDIKIVNKLSAVTILGNVFLAGFKMIAGIFGNSGAMVSDAVHSLSDVLTTLIAYVGVKLSKKNPDEKHPYGHERFECVASLSLSLLLAVTGIGIGYAGLMKILGGDVSKIEVPTFLPLIAAIISVAVKEGMYWYTMYYAKRLNSSAFKADAWHHRSDAFSSIGSFIGIGAAKLGFPIMDPIASIIICFFILKVAYDVGMDALNKMIDTSCSHDFECDVEDFIKKQEGVQGVDTLRTRQFGNKIYIDLEIAVDRNLSLLAAHDIAERVHAAVEEQYPDVKHIMVHVNPGK